MRQNEVLEILLASKEPMTVLDIVQAHGVREHYVDTDRAKANLALRRLEGMGLVRRAGWRESTSSKGSPFVLWEAAE